MLASARIFAAPVDYNRTVRPILSNNCFKCHGPDAGERKAGLRLDVRDEALRPLKSGSRAIVPGKLDESRLVSRIFSPDPDEVMPPPVSQKKLTQAEKEVLRQWIAGGAPYQMHWAFVPPVRPAAPSVRHVAWPRNEVDSFILARLEAEGLEPSREADRTVLIRRVTLDLTGLPPSLAEVDAFLGDTSRAAYEKVVDRLLASPRYGERMAIEWLDAARFADTHGYHIDSGRDMTRWREWVIDSFNRNLRFDEFTVEQLAGDLLPNASVEQRIASGFHRNHMINFEGGAIPEEYQTAYIVDRVNTTGTVWLGLTIACSQCHDHKFDPIMQKEYYQLFAFFHNVPENGLDGSKGNAAPLLKVPTTEEAARLEELGDSMRELETKLSGPLPEVDAAQMEWEKSAAAARPPEWVVLDPDGYTSSAGATIEKLADRSLRATGKNPARETYRVSARTEAREITAVRVEALTDDSLPSKGPGRSENGNIVLTDVRVAVGPALDAVNATPVSLKAASADFSQQDFSVAAAIDDRADTGWAIFPEIGKPHAAVFELDAPLRSDAGTYLSITLDFQSGFGQHQMGRFRIAATSSRDPHIASALPAKVLDVLAIAPEKRTSEQAAELREYYRSNISPEAKQLKDRLVKLRQSKDAIEKKIRTTMVMQELEQPRDTFILVRGQYDKQGEKVSAGVPAFLPPLPAGAPANRLGLARWLVDPAQPLTARVLVNRYWQMYFGTGLVKTAEDFGSQGETPSHPELLDWLAVEFVESGWNVKALQRLIVTSATYRQSSAVAPELHERDPENRLLAHGPRIRMPAELIRDLALSVSGLLDGRIGGASVSPYQPPGLWEELASREDGANWTAQVYTQSHGSDLYRRTLYTFWKRTSPPPTLATFDAPDRETCTVRRSRTNTPLQALILMNDPTYIEAARKLAERMMREGGASLDDHIAFAFRLATARGPSVAEIDVLWQIHDEQLTAFRGNPQAALKLVAVGESKRDEALDTADLAAWTMVASAILNLDETVTKG